MEYTVKRSKRKTVSIEITGERRVLVRAPLYMSLDDIDGFVRKYGGWIDKGLPMPKGRRNLPSLCG